MMPPDSFPITMEAIGINSVITADKGFLCKLYEVDKSYKLAACSKGKVLPDKVNITDILNKRVYG